MPEISPELAARIETLRASHAENPARFFMPLASAYREAGEVGRAEELLRENLKRHPGYLSAHVLLGRCLADRGAYAEARNEFQYVLSVDGQNLIALRTLGDMAAQGGDTGEARRWYGELLSVDPMNTEARQALATLEHAPAAPRAAPRAQADEQGGFGMVEIASHAPEADLPHAGHDDPGAWGAISLDQPAAAGEPAPAAPDASADGFDALDFGAVDLTVADEQPGQSASAAAGPAAAGSSAEEAPAAGAGGFDAWGSIDDGQIDIDVGGVEPLPLESFYDEAAPGSPPGPAHHDDHEEHGEVVTETIAELYAQQGFPDRAAEVYRELIARRGQEPALVRRLEELEAQLGGGQPRQDAPSEGVGDEGDADAGGFGGFGAIDLDVPDAEPAQAAAGEGESAPAWLASVDAFVSGNQETPVDAAPAAGDPDLPAPPFGGGFDLPAADFGGDFELPAFDAEPAAPAAHSAGASPEADAEPARAYANASAITGDAFADSFAHGFEGAGRAEWQAPSVEETEPTPEVEQAIAGADQPVDLGSGDLSTEPGSDDQPLDFASTDEPAVASGPGFAPSAEDSASVDAAAETQAEPAASGDTSAAETQPAPSGERVSIVSYLGSILAWRPGAASAATPASPEAPAAPVDETRPPVEDAAAPPPVSPWDEETLGASEQQPPMDEPWMAEPPAAAHDDSAADEPWAAASGAASAPDADPWAAPAAEPTADALPADEPWSAPAEPQAEPTADEPWAIPAEPQADSAAADEPWSQPGGEADDAGEDLPWLSTEAAQPDTPAQGTEPAAGGPAAGAEPMPWETSFDLSPEVPTEPTADRAPPRQEPAAEPGGFSFEDFFNEQPATPPEPEPQAAAPAPAFEPVAPPPPAEPAQPQNQGGDEDEDLESFQAWLQSLKR